MFFSVYFIFYIGKEMVFQLLFFFPFLSFYFFLYNMAVHMNNYYCCVYDHVMST